MMQVPNVKVDTQAEVNGCLASDQMFTAFDITKILRATDPTVKHYQVKEEVHRMYEDGDMLDSYMRKLMDIGDGHTAYVYYPDNKDPDDYVNALKTQTLQATSPSDVQPDPAQDGTSDQVSSAKPIRTLMRKRGWVRQKGDERNIYANGRLRVPVRILKKAGILPNWVVHVKFMPNIDQMVIQNRPLGAFDHLGQKVIKVTLNNDMDLSFSLKRYGISGKRFKFTVDGKVIRAERVA